MSNFETSQKDYQEYAKLASSAESQFTLILEVV